MRNNLCFKVYVGLVLVLCGLPVQAALYLDQQNSVELAGYLTALPDPHTKFTIQDVVSRIV